MKKTYLIIMLLPLAGCNFQSEQVRQFANLADKVVAVTEQLTDTVVPMVESLNEQGVVSDSDKENITKLAGEVTKVNAHVAEISTALKEVQQDDLQGLVEAGRAVNKATSPYNPYSGVVEIALLALSGILGIFAKKKTDEANLSAKALAQTVVGVQKAKDSLTDTGVRESINIQLAKAQDQDTKDVIALIKNKV